MDFPAGICRARLGRWRYDSHADHLGDRSTGLGRKEVQHPLRRNRQEVGAVRGVGLSRQWRLYAAGTLEIVGRSPWTAADALVGLLKSRTRGSGADEGVRPTA